MTLRITSSVAAARLPGRSPPVWPDVQGVRAPLGGAFGGGPRRDVPAVAGCRSDQLRRSWVLRRAASRDDPARRLGLPDREFGAGARSPTRSRAASRGRLSAARDPACGGWKVEMIEMAIARDTVMGTSMEVAVARRDRLVAGQAAADRVVAAIDQSCSRVREDSELRGGHRQGG